MELYVLLRNPAVVEHPLSASRAVAMCQAYRENRYWRIIDYPASMSRSGSMPPDPTRPADDIRCRRLAYTLRHHGVNEFATRDLRISRISASRGSGILCWARARLWRPPGTAVRGTRWTDVDRR